jgi:hypothetical protein
MKRSYLGVAILLTFLLPAAGSLAARGGRPGGRDAIGGNPAHAAKRGKRKTKNSRAGTA